MNPLESATADELWDELRKRFPGGIVMSGIRPDVAGDKADICDMWYSGGVCVCIGLAYRTMASITRASLADDKLTEET